MFKETIFETSQICKWKTSKLRCVDLVVPLATTKISSGMRSRAPRMWHALVTSIEEGLVVFVTVVVQSQVICLDYCNVILCSAKGDRTDKRDTSAFNTWKDIIIPGNVEDGMTKTGSPMVQPLPLSKRKYLANYLGRAQGKAGRLQLIELSKQFPEKLECPDLKFSGGEKLGRKDYFEHLRNSKFCLAPRGESSWTLRFYESFFVECVPVILSDQIELPFQNVIDYSQISIKWPSSRIGPELLEYLESIPDKDIEAIIARGRQVRCMWVYASDSEPCSAMRGIMWELQRKVRQFHQSAEISGYGFQKLRSC